MNIIEQCVPKLAQNMKVSFYCTTLNEESSIKLLLDSILYQTKQPDEIIIVDGGSNDKTVDIITQYIKKGVPIKLIISKGSNVAQGRNIGIQNSRYDIIASIDAGCIADSDWLQNIINKFDCNTHVVSGIGLADAKNLFEECYAELFYRKDLFKADWPAHQNIAIRREVYEEIQYPDNCYRSEDTWFNIKIMEKGFNCKLAENAFIYWRPRENLRQVFKYFYLEAKSNIENNVRVKETSSIALNNLIRLVWEGISIITLLIVFIFVSKLGAVLLCPFILKNMINLYRENNRISAKKILYKNTIYNIGILASSLGFLVGKIAVKNKR